MSGHFTRAALPRRLARDARRMMSGSGRAWGSTAQSWRDWLLFSIAYGIIVAAILFTAPQHAGGSAARADGRDQTIVVARGS